MKYIVTILLACCLQGCAPTMHTKTVTVTVDGTGKVISKTTEETITQQVGQQPIVQLDYIK